MRITFNPNVTSVSPIKRVAPKYRARSAHSIDDVDPETLQDVVISISAEARQKALQENLGPNGKQGPGGFWNSISKMINGGI
jgi:hypothetical protein